MGKVTLDALPLGKGLMRDLDGRVRGLHLLPVALEADLVHITPQLGGVRTLEVMAYPTGAIPKRLVDIVQTRYRRRSQTLFGGAGGWCRRHKRRRCRCRRWRGRAPSTTAQKEHEEEDETDCNDNLTPAG